MKVFLSGYYNVGPVGQRPEFFGDGVIILTPHDAMMTFGGLHEILHIVRQMPGEIVLPTDDMIFGKGSNKGNNHKWV